LGRVEVVIETRLELTIRARVAWALELVLSVTRTVKVKEPEAVGAPERVPFWARLRPLGRAPPMREKV
jgi:hypothetical protein